MKFPKTEETTTFQRRTGADPFGQSGWRGVVTEKDPGALDPNQLQYGLNIRLGGAEILSRPGLEFMVDLKPYTPAGLPGMAGVSSPVMWMCEAPVASPHVRLWFVVFGCQLSAAGTRTPGGTVMHLDPFDDPVVQVYSRFSAQVNKQVPIGAYGDVLLCCDKAVLREVVLLSAPPSIPASEMSPSPPSSPLASWPGSSATCCLAFDGQFFIGLVSDTVPATQSQVVVWNGFSLRNDPGANGPAPKAMGIWRNKLVVGYDGLIKVRSQGDPPGSWTTVSLAGFTCSTSGNAMCEYRDKLYIAGGNDKIYSFDGTTLALFHTVPTAAVDGKGVTCLARVDDLLHYGWNAASPYAASIGRYDPDSTALPFVEAYKALTTQIAGFKQVSSLAFYRQQLYAGGEQIWIVACAPGNIPGTAEIVSQQATGPNTYQVTQLLSFPEAL